MECVKNNLENSQKTTKLCKVAMKIFIVFELVGLIGVCHGLQFQEKQCTHQHPKPAEVMYRSLC